MKKFHGFTLIELLITVTVVVIVLALAVPAFTNYTASWRLTSQANELVAAIHTARSESIKRNRSVSFCRVAADNATSCAGGVNARWLHWVVTEGGNAARRESPGNLGNTIHVSSTFASDTITFRPDGLPMATATLVVCTTAQINENRRVINVGPGNRVSITRAPGNCP